MCVCVHVRNACDSMQGRTSTSTHIHTTLDLAWNTHTHVHMHAHPMYRCGVAARRLLGHNIQLEDAAVQVAGDEQRILCGVVGQRLGALQGRSVCARMFEQAGTGTVGAKLGRPGMAWQGVLGWHGLAGCFGLAWLGRVFWAGMAWQGDQGQHG